jgi:hypothetical protein
MVHFAIKLCGYFLLLLPWLGGNTYALKILIYIFAETNPDNNVINTT